MECQEFFLLHKLNGEICKEIQQLAEELQVDWELQSVSVHSPGAVDNAEVIIRQVMSPLHFDEETGEFKASLFSDVKDKGLSVNRASFTTDEDLKASLAVKVAKANDNPNRTAERAPWGLLPFTSLKIRSITVKGDDGMQRRALGIYDTAKLDDRSHADVCQLLKEGGNARSVRKTLLDLANAWLKSQPVT